MAFPVRQSVTQTDWALSPTDHNVDMPATVNAGDLLIIIFGMRNTGGATATTPSGWTKIGTETSQGACLLYVYAKAAAGDEGGGTVNVVTSAGKNASAHAYRLTGWRNSGTIANDVEAAFATTANDSPNPPSLNPSNWATEDTKWIAACTYSGDDSATALSAYPASYSDGVVNPATVSFTLHAVASAHRDNAVAAEDPGVFTMNGTANAVSVTIGVRPAAAASGPAGVKTVNGVLIASVKTVNGVALASVKTIQGVA